ncbi:MAG: Phosphatidate cytidylyltransferase [Verrucomicrobiaceae bacterium]|nr:Phosphatidate cytidylyltransferase [Verrucomicrobiaceae bacterium]
MGMFPRCKRLYLPMATPSPVPVSTPPSKRRIFITRLASSLVLWAVMLLAIIWKSQPLFVAIACFFGVAGAAEYFRLLARDLGSKSFPALGMVICLCHWAAVLHHVLSYHTEPPWGIDLAALVVAVQGCFLLCYRRNLEGEMTLKRIFATVFGVVYTVIFFGFIVRLMYFQSDGSGLNGAYLMLFVIMVTKFTDMGAYLLGSAIGKHKMIPHISPAKTWEGLAGAMIAGFAAAIIMLVWAPVELRPLSWFHALALVPILCFCGVTGDLAESILKRCLAIKDSGHKLPGIGGILDLTDSLLFTAPVFYFYLRAIQ